MATLYIAVASLQKTSRVPLRSHLGLAEKTQVHQGPIEAPLVPDWRNTSATGPHWGPTWAWVKKHKCIRAPLRPHLCLTEETHVHQGPTEAPLGPDWRNTCLRPHYRPHLCLTEETHVHQGPTEAPLGPDWRNTWASGPHWGPTWPWLKKHKCIRAPLTFVVEYRILLLWVLLQCRRVVIHICFSCAIPQGPLRGTVL